MGCAMSTNIADVPVAYVKPQVKPQAQPQAQPHTIKQIRQLDVIDEDVDWDHLCEEAAEVACQNEEEEDDAIRQLDEEWEDLCNEAVDTYCQEYGENLQIIDQIEEDHMNSLIDSFQAEEEDMKQFIWRRNILLLIAISLLSYNISPLFVALLPAISIINEKEQVIVDPTYKTD